MVRYVFPLFFFVTACDTAGPGFHGIPKVEREVEGSRFTLRFRDTKAEVIRTSPEMLPRFETVARKAAIAVKQETGCDTAWVTGDAAMMVLGMACSGRAAPKRPARTDRSAVLLCELDGLKDRAYGQVSCALE